MSPGTTPCEKVHKTGTLRHKGSMRKDGGSFMQTTHYHSPRCSKFETWFILQKERSDRCDLFEENIFLRMVLFMKRNKEIKARYLFLCTTTDTPQNIKHNKNTENIKNKNNFNSPRGSCERVLPENYCQHTFFYNVNNMAFLGWRFNRSITDFSTGPE